MYMDHKKLRNAQSVFYLLLAACELNVAERKGDPTIIMFLTRYSST